jgi:PAS domain S-box-containing protein
MGSARASRWFLIAGLALTCAWYLLPADGDARALVWPALNLGATLAIVTAMVRRPTMRRLPWALFAAGMALYTVGDLFFLSRPILLDVAPTFPSAADAAYIPSYVLLVGGLAALVRTRARDVDRGNLIDVAIISVGLGLLTWVLFMAPYAYDARMAESDKLVSLAYPALDVLLFAVLVRLSVGSGRRTRSYRLLFGFVVAQLLADLVYSAQVLVGTFTLSSPIMGVYCIGWVFIGAAALHPSADERAEVASEARAAQPRRRLSALITAAMIPPALMMIQAVRGAHTDLPAMALGSALLLLLTMVRLRGLMVDVDQHKAVADRLADTERRFRELFDNVPAVTYVDVYRGSDPERIVSLHLGPQVEELFGYSRNEWLATGDDLWQQLVLPEDLPAVLEAGARAVEMGTRFRSEYRVLTKDGRTRWVREEASIEIDDATRDQTWRGVMYDITEHRELESALREAEIRYRTLIEQLPTVAYSEVVDRGRSSSYYLSPQVERVLGYPPSRWTREEHFWRGLIHPEDAPEALGAKETSTLTGVPYACEYRMRHADGRWIWIRDEAVMIDGTPGGREVWHGVLADVTERKVAELDLQLTMQELQRLSADRALLLERLVDAQEDERGRIAQAIHDDPLQKLTAVGLRLDALASHMNGPEGREALDRLRGTVGAATGRLRHLLFELRPRALDTGGLAEAMGEYLDELAAEDGVEYRLANRLDGEPGQQTRLIAYRIAQEALRNVQRHAGARQVDVSLSSGDGGLFVSVVDDGRGASAETVADSPRGHLGIRSMRERAGMAGGWFRIESRQDAGTRVEFWLPDLSAPPEPLPEPSADLTSTRRRDEMPGSVPTPGSV